MRKKTIIAIFVLSNLITFSQNVDLAFLNMNGNQNIFGTSYGYGISYSIKVKSNQIRFQIGQLNYQKQYDDIFINLTNGVTTTEIVKPNNNRYFFKTAYCITLLNTELSKIKIGPELSLNYFTIKESYFRTYPKGDTYSRTDSKKNRLGIGAFIEYELFFKEKKNISLFMQSEVERTNYHEFGLMDDSNDPSGISWIGFNLGIRYNFKIKK